MAKVYRPFDGDQPFLFPPDMREWLPPDHPVGLVIRAVDEHMDTSAVHAGRRTSCAASAGCGPGLAGDRAGVGVCAPGDLVAGDRAAVRDRCGVPGDLRG